MSALLAILASGAAAVPSTTRIALGPGTNLVVDANSYYAAWIYLAIDAVGDFAALMATTGTTHANVAIPGQTWDDMRAAPADRDALLDPGKRNLLVCGEDRNTVANRLLNFPAATNQQHVDATIAAARRYIAAARAAGWQDVLKCLTIPSAEFADGTRPELDQPLNDILVEVDQWWRDNYEAEGVVEVADFRAHAPEWFGFEWDGSRSQGFMASTATCATLGPGGTPDDVHPIGAARDAFAGAIAAGLRRAAGLA